MRQLDAFGCCAHRSIEGPAIPDCGSRNRAKLRLASSLRSSLQPSRRGRGTVVPRSLPNKEFRDIFSVPVAKCWVTVTKKGTPGGKGCLIVRCRDQCQACPAPFLILIRSPVQALERKPVTVSVGFHFWMSGSPCGFCRRCTHVE